jgi:adenosylcobinamide-phosphate synthase
LNLLAILAAIAIEQFRGVRGRAALARTFRRYARALEQRFNAGSAREGNVAAALALAPPVLIVVLVYWGLLEVNVILAWVWSAGVLTLVLAFGNFSHAFSAISEALRAGDVAAARSRLVAWRGSDAAGANAVELPKLAIEQGLLDSYRHVFATLFWFLLLPGPSGALLYKLARLLAEQWRGDMGTPQGAATATPQAAALAQFGEPARALLRLLDWAPARLTAITFAIVGDFEDAAYCWRTQSPAWPARPDNIILASGAGALGCALGGVVTEVNGLPKFRPELGLSEPADVDTMPSATGLVWRGVLVWLGLLLLLTLAHWAP